MFNQENHASVCCFIKVFITGILQQIQQLFYCVYAFSNHKSFGYGKGCRTVKPTNVDMDK